MCKCGNGQPVGCDTEYQYAVKVVGGTFAATPEAPVASGRYFTAINIHNPSKCDTATIRWKTAEALPLKAGAIVDRRPFTLRPDEAIELDNPQLIIPPATFLKGFAVLHSSHELDVVAVYSGSQSNGGMNAFHTERVPVRCVPVCEDLELRIDTGVADWKLLTSAGPAPVFVLSPHPSWGVAPGGSSWIGASPTDGTQAPAGGPQRTYELAFDLCYGFTASQLTLQGLADDSATISVNGAPLTPALTSLSTTINVPVPLTALRAGRNVIQVNLTNTGAGGNGFALAGVLRAAGGRCPCSPLPVRKPTAAS